MSVYSENSYKLFYGSMTFGNYSIAGKNSWITTDESTDIDELKLWLKIELNKLPSVFEKYNDVDKAINEKKNSSYQNDKAYGFLLKDNNKTEELKLWLESKNKKIEELKKINLEISRQLELIKKENKQSWMEKEIKYNRLWSEQKSNELKIEDIKSFIKKINE
jgi:hypothetical protein